MAVGGHAWPGRFHQPSPVQDRKSPFRNSARVSAPGPGEDTRGKKSFNTETGSAAQTLLPDILSEEVRCASEKRWYFTDRSPADVNVTQDIVTRRELRFARQARLATMCSLCFPTCRKLRIAQHPHFPTDSDAGKLVTEGHFAHVYNDS